ncbi:MAG: hypothetical protein WAK48_13005 [Candidatus Acidiferrum sp.]
MTIKVGASQTEKDRTMRFYFEPQPFTGITDVMSVQAIGEWGDNRFVIEAETEDEAREKLLDLLEKRIWEGEVRPATEDESKEFEESQDEAKECRESALRIHEQFAKGLGKEESHGKE